MPLAATFIAAIQEHERVNVPELKPGREIADDYVKAMVRRLRENDGLMLMARQGADTVGFVAGWVEMDQDPCLREEARRYALVSDIYVVDAARRQGIAHRLLGAFEQAMRERGCRRLRLCAKATNPSAIACYEAAGYRPYELILSKPVG
ncbi:MAG TPA: GNAT family N-acetyltransferase [Stellaceae bacterium]|nr:GNAT family N-acetyltransferase [Stellaceae bacterium]